MKVIVDAMGGDNAPLEILKGCALAVKELEVDIILVGDRERIESVLKENNIDLKPLEIIHTAEQIGMEDDAASILKAHKNCSMAIGLQLLAQGKGEAFVSAGNTGALTVGATFLVKRIKGIKRPAIASIMPTTKTPVLLMDCGANVDCRSEMLYQFGLMGDVYMKKIRKLASPRVALANNGTEPTKGTELVKAAYEHMQQADYQFIGNIEARQIPYGDCDVVVADGFTGNIILKMYEGVAAALLGSLKGIFYKNFKNKIAALMLKSSLDEFKAQMDYKEYGGAVLLGIKKPVVKAHGSSDARGFKNAIRQGVQFASTGVVEEIGLRASALGADSE